MSIPLLREFAAAGFKQKPGRQPHSHAGLQVAADAPPQIRYKQGRALLPWLWVILLSFAYPLQAQTDQYVFAWGTNTNSQLGDGTTNTRLAPLQIGTATNWKSIDGGRAHSLAIRRDNTLWGWGYNANGQLGDGTTAQKTAPVQVGTDANWAVVATGADHSLGIRTDGLLWVWGYNVNGQLGDGTTTQRVNPTWIRPLETWRSVAAGGHHSLAIRSDGTLWAWGLNDKGQLGNNSTTTSLSPVQIGTDNDWKFIAAGANHSLAIKTNGTLWAWGFNEFGQVGDGTVTTVYAPKQIGAATDWVSVSGGYHHSLAIKTNGTLWAWGHNGHGRLGDNSTTDRSAPVQIGAATNWASVSAGWNHSTAVKGDGTLWTWGYNAYAQLGDGTLTDRLSPQRLGTSNNWKQVTGGAVHTLALSSDTEKPVILTKNITAALSASGTVTVVPADVDNGSTDNTALTARKFAIYGTINENGYLTLTAPAGTVFDAVVFASYGTPTGTDGNYSLSSCHAANSKSTLESYLIGNNTATIQASNSIFGDPCFGVGKRLYVVATYRTAGADAITFSCKDQGAKTLNLLGLDAAGNYALAPATVTVEDKLVPTLTLPANVSVNNDANSCSAVVTYAQPTASDNCGFFQPVISGFTKLGTHNGSLYYLSGATYTATSAFADAQAKGGFVVTINNAAENAFLQNVLSGKASNVLLGLNDAAVEGTFVWQSGEAVSYTNWNGTEPNNYNGNEDYAEMYVNSGGLWNDYIGDGRRYVLEIPEANITQTAGLPSGSAFPLGTTTNTFRVTDAAGNTTTASFTVTVADAEAPAVLTQNITVQLDAAGNASITPAQINNGSTDNCTAAGALTLSLDKTSFTCANVGANTVTLTVTDAAANSGTATATVTVEDKVAPVITLPANLSVNTDAGTCGAVITYAPTASDNCGFAQPVITGFTSLGKHNGKLYYLSDANYLATSAFADAQAKGGFVVTINNADENAFLFNMLSGKVTTAMIGFTDAAVEGNFVWQSGEPVSYLNWYTGEPNDVNGEDYAEMYVSVGGYWNDYQGQSQGRRYVLEIPEANIIQTAGLPSGSAFPLGTTTNTFQVTDAAGNTTTASFTVTVADAEAPAVLTQNITVQLDAAGNASITPAQINNGSTDNCTAAGALTLSLDKTSFTCANAGANTVTLTVRDAVGNSSTATATVTVTDAIAPTALANDLVVELGTGGTVSITPAQIDGGSTDNCSIASMSLDVTDFSCAEAGKGCSPKTALSFDGVNDYVEINNPYYTFGKELTVSWWVNFQGNSAWMTQSTRGVDNMNENVWLMHTSSANALIWYVNDNGTWRITSLATTNGWHMITGTADAQGVRLYVDGVLASSTTGISGQIRNNANSKIHIGIDGRYYNRYENFQADEVLVYNKSLTATEIQALYVSCPEVTDAALVGYWPLNEGTGTAVADLSASGANGTLNNMASSSWIKSGAAVNSAGANDVVLTVTDAAGNSSTATAKVFVVDKIAPTATAQNITVQLDATGNATITAAQINNGSADNCTAAADLILSLDKTSFTCAEAGANTVTLTVKDAAGNSSTATATVTVEDKLAPSLTAQNVTLQLDASGSATLTEALAVTAKADNCSVPVISFSKTSFTCADAGANTVTVTATDAAGNATTQNITVTVEDKIAPSLTAQNVTLQLDATGNATLTEAAVVTAKADNCGLPTISFSKTSFSCTEAGANTTVTVTATDASGNTATQDITVTLEDNIDPNAIAQNITVQLNATGNATITAAQINNNSADNCTAAGALVLSLDKTSFTCANLGANTVTLTVTDAAGNSSSTTATVTVEDKIAPVALAKNIIVQLDAAGTVSIVATDVENGSTDNCGSVSLALDKTSFTCANIGDNTVTLTVTDASGNSHTATATVTVEDNIDPSAVAQNISVQLDATGTATITASQINNNSTDNCTAAADLVMSLDKTSFSCAEVGGNTVTLTVTDAAGNSSTATAIVTVAETIAPVISTCPANRSVDIWADRPYTVADFSAALTATDNCAVTSISQSLAAGTVLDQPGEQLITMTVTDAAGNQVQCSFTLTVVYNNTAPKDLLLSDNTIEEHQPAQTFIGSFSAVDIDADESFTYALVAGDGSEGNASFYISGNELYANSYFDHEVQSSYSIRVSVTDKEGASLEKVFTIEVLNEAGDARVYVPNLFSPNADGENDTFRIRAGGVAEISLRIFNRMGELVFETSNVGQAVEMGWDGSYKGKEMPSGSYIWQLQGKYTDGTPISVEGKNTGNIILIR